LLEGGFVGQGHGVCVAVVHVGSVVARVTFIVVLTVALHAVVVVAEILRSAISALRLVTE
jgi:hypothetical protein